MRRRIIISAAVLVVALLAVPIAQASHTFTDVPTSNTFHDDIDWLASTGITLGCRTAGPEFCPDTAVTRGQMAAFLRRTVNYIESESDTPRMYKHTSTTGNIESRRTILDHPELNSNPNALITVTHIFRDGYIEEPLGVWYDDARDRWTIFREDPSVTSFPENYDFTVTFVP